MPIIINSKGKIEKISKENYRLKQLVSELTYRDKDYQPQVHNYANEALDKLAERMGDES